MGKPKAAPAAMLEDGPTVHKTAQGAKKLPVRWQLERRGRTLKVVGADKSKPDDYTLDPLLYVERHQGHCSKPRLLMHESGHKKDKSPVVAHISLPKTGKMRWLGCLCSCIGLKGGNPKDFKIVLPAGFNGRERDSVIQMQALQIRELRDLARSKTYQITMRTATGRDETFQWIDYSSLLHAADEIHLAHKADMPSVKSGDPRPAKPTEFKAKVSMSNLTKKFTGSGWMMVRLSSPNRCPAGSPRPLGWTEQGHEIVATMAQPMITGTGIRCALTFQFWGAAAKGQLGEEFTRVATLTAINIWDIEDRERQRKMNEMGQNRR
ncbi:hypothetical protein B0H63DRAFT_560396 [Podospora didyma]|uniref:Uncharacterized protein n=1 Tax=Podospora didyma TaxID=330526 RepID=A0AAE0NR23_9PEZI|nr:hypothetical protein B0H63DRAFT_560396 [Podospora didyma]